MIWINLKIKRTNNEDNIYEKYLVWLVRLVNSLYSWAFKKSAGGVKDQIMSLFKTKGYSKPGPAKTVYRGGKKHSQENTIKSVRNLFKLKKKEKRRN